MRPTKNRKGAVGVTCGVGLTGFEPATSWSRNYRSSARYLRFPLESSLWGDRMNPTEPIQPTLPTDSAATCCNRLPARFGIPVRGSQTGPGQPPSGVPLGAIEPAPCRFPARRQGVGARVADLAIRPERLRPADCSSRGNDPHGAAPPCVLCSTCPLAAGDPSTDRRLTPAASATPAWRAGAGPCGRRPPPPPTRPAAGRAAGRRPSPPRPAAPSRRPPRSGRWSIFPA